MSRLTAGLIALALAIAIGCESDRRPVHQAGEPVGTASGPSTIAGGSSARTSEPQVADAARAGCAAIVEVLRNAAMAFGDSSSAIASAGDTTATLGDTGPGASEAACVLAWSDSTARAAPLYDVYARLEQSGWQRRYRLLDASGPDGDALAFSRGGAACVVSGAWDGGDDSDSTYVPAPGFTIRVTCFRDRPDPS